MDKAEKNLMRLVSVAAIFGSAIEFGLNSPEGKAGAAIIAGAGILMNAIFVYLGKH